MHVEKSVIVSIRNLSKVRPLEGAAAYTLTVPRLDVRAGEKVLITGPSGSGKSTFLDLLGMVLKPDSAESFIFSPADTTGQKPGASSGQGLSDAKRTNSGQRLSDAKRGEADAGQSMADSRQRAGADAERGEADSGQSVTDAVQSMDNAGPVLEDPVRDVITGSAWDIAYAWHTGRLEDLARWRRSIGYVLQTGGLLPFLTVRDNIAAPRRLLGLPEDGSVNSLVRDLGIAPLLDKLPARLSVGERQRAAIARALAARPALVLADEPTAALDPGNAASVLSLFSDMVSALGVTLIMVTHAPEQMTGMGFRRLEVRQHTTLDQGREAVLEEYSQGGGL